MLEYLTLYEFLVALAVALSGLCAFIWAVSAGLFRDVERAKYRVVDVERERPDG